MYHTILKLCCLTLYCYGLLWIIFTVDGLINIRNEFVKPNISFMIKLIFCLGNIFSSSLWFIIYIPNERDRTKDIFCPAMTSFFIDIAITITTIIMIIFWPVIFCTLFVLLIKWYCVYKYLKSVYKPTDVVVVDVVDQDDDQDNDQDNDQDDDQDDGPGIRATEDIEQRPPTGIPVNQIIAEPVIE